MVSIFIALFWALVCPDHTNTTKNCNHGSQVTTMDDTGGETGHVPPHPPIPPKG